MSPEHATVRSDGSEKDRPTSAESFSGVENDGRRDGDDDGHDDNLAPLQPTDSTPTLTLSKARAIALVATVTGASFLNVSAVLLLL